MKDILIKARRAIRFLFYRDVSIEDQILVSNTLDDSELEILFWKLNKADRHHSIEVLHRTMKHTDNSDVLKLALLHDIGKGKGGEHNKKGEEISKKIVISEYLLISNHFFGNKEATLLNGVLDNLR